MEKADAEPFWNISKSKDFKGILTLEILVSGRLSEITGGAVLGLVILNLEFHYFDK